ncbi:tRNA 5-methylaminomethyl-2-thiouridine biosynthesis bifunctional protein MnmC [mine drainage metagenome]|uniref:tRNA 5-methylaminomethyl-2-thiouridine biosynthesis bifunctional protein MnmC n=1 Tax=mine drainage metagenome TaxID=410659 RepID=A0A1J5SU40_9ZZZZ
MLKQVIKTGDGSNSIFIPEMNVAYHSIHGAVQESNHVFIKAGLKPLLHQHQTINIFEMGFGTGLNALLSLQTAVLHQQKINYTTVELFPLTPEEVVELNYADENFVQLHRCDWEKDMVLNDRFSIHKTNQSLINYSTGKKFNLVYFDAFDPNTQPELWTKEIFEKLFLMMASNGILVTYSSKGNVRRAMLEAGFSVEKIPGPPHKREMIRAKKTTDNG